MAPLRLGGAQKPLEFGTPGGGGRILAQDQPFAIGVIDAGAEAQAPLAGPLGGQGRLGIQQFPDQAPGAHGRGLIESGFQQGGALLGRQGLQEPNRFKAALGSDQARLLGGQQQAGSRLGKSPGLEVIGEHIQRRPAHHGAVLPAQHRQQQGLQPGRAGRPETLQGQGGPAVVHGGLGGPPLHQQPLQPLGPGRRADPIEHREGRLGLVATEQYLRVGEHHGQGLGRRQNQQQPLTDPAEAIETVLLHDPLTTLGQLLEGSMAQQLLKLGLAERRWYRGRRGKRRRRGKQRCRGGLEQQGR